MTVLAPSEQDLNLFHQSNSFRSYLTLGAHLTVCDGISGVRFTVWAPRARQVCVVGDFNKWCGTQHEMERVDDSGVWMLFVPDLDEGTLYKYEIVSPYGETFLKADPYAFYSEVRPNTASVIYSLPGYEWEDAEWQRNKKKRQNPVFNKPVLIYEVHLGSWKRNENGDPYTYRQLADELVDYVADLGYTHIELMPLAEHPYDRSWGYQATGYYAVTSRFGTPHDFMYFVDRCHQQGIGVILDWVPGHFAKDAHGLRLFDGTPTYEYEDSRKAEKWQWGTLSFDFGRPEVIQYLISNAMFWFDVFHIDGLRIDAVASIIDLNFGKSEGMERVYNQYGGEENLEAIAFLRKLNEVIFESYPQALMMAEDSTDYPLVSAPTYVGGLGFNFKWNMGWMNDTLRYLEFDPIHRKYHHNLLTFPIMYAYSENFMLPLSHDEVVHLKKSLLNKMPGDYWQKFANLRLLYGYMMTHPGKKLLFMGGEFGQFDEWDESKELHWNLFDYEKHRQLFHFTKQLNQFYRLEKGLWELDHDPAGYEWIDADNHSQSVLVYMRKGKKAGDTLIVVCNFTPVVHENFRIGVPKLGKYVEVFNSDSPDYGGSGQANREALTTDKTPWHNQSCSVTLTLPPLAMIVLKKKKLERKGKA